MNGWLRPIPYFLGLKSLSTRQCRTWRPPRTLLHRRTQSTLENVDTSPSPTPLSDILTVSHVAGPIELPFLRRTVLVSNIPPGTTSQELLSLVDTGALESIQTSFHEDGLHAELSFLHGYSAARFAFNSEAKPLLVNGCALSCTMLPYRPLDPVVAGAVEKDRARRTLILAKARDRDDKIWTSYRLGPYFGYQVEEIAVREVKDARSPYREVAVVQFRDIRNAIRAHARIRADPFMRRVHVAYGTDKCEIPSGKPGPATPSAVDTALANEPLRYPTYLPVEEAHKSHRPFTTVKLSNLAPETTLRDLCKRIYGGPLYAIDLHADGTADVTFLHAEAARDFYADAKTHALTIHGRPLFIEPRLGMEAAVAAQPPRCSRVISVTALDWRVALSRRALRQDFEKFGVLEDVHVHPRTRCLAYVSFAHAPSALRALTHLPIAHPGYLACTLRFARDPCASPRPFASSSPSSSHLSSSASASSAFHNAYDSTPFHAPHELDSTEPRADVALRAETSARIPLGRYVRPADADGALMDFDVLRRVERALAAGAGRRAGMGKCRGKGIGRGGEGRGADKGEAVGKGRDGRGQSGDGELDVAVRPRVEEVGWPRLRPEDVWAEEAPSGEGDGEDDGGWEALGELIGEAEVKGGRVELDALLADVRTRIEASRLRAEDMHEDRSCGNVEGEGHPSDTVQDETATPTTPAAMEGDLSTAESAR
ncbi:hypothetical protein C8R47DRAFT_562641 [Mycena vitilis]|nr:hypothetical protein C8R47DRAFT_562641 [Mycena vitilis]